MPDFISINRNHWNAITPGHLTSEFYDVESFRAGRDTIDDIESTLVGNVAGKTLLHLQCHFGMDTMSWTRRGAQATGVDFSEIAISAAAELASDLNLDTRFRVGNVLDLDLNETFDVVFTSHGVLGWLPDLRAWGRTVARHLAPGGRFVVLDAHPVLLVYDDERTDDAMEIRYDYFDRADLEFTQIGSYADPTGPETHTVFRIHPLSEVFASLTDVGLTVTGFEEYGFVAWQAMPHMVRGEDGWWRLPEGQPRIPLMFSMTATR